MIAYPHHSLRQTLDLSGVWDFAFLGNADPAQIRVKDINFTERMLVPLSFDAVAPHRGERGLAAYRLSLDVPASARARIDFPGLGPWSAVFADGKKLREHDCPFTPTTVDIEPGHEQDIVILVDNRFDRSRLPGGPFPNHDWYQYGGIFRPPVLHLLPQVSIGKVLLRTQDWKKGIVEAEIFLDGSGPVEILSCRVDGSEILRKPLRGSGGESVRLTFRTKNPSSWDFDAPNLHTVSFRTKDDDWNGRFGLREIAIKGDHIVLNGRSIRLIGVNRHETHPEFGHAVPPAVMQEDIRLIKDLGCNFVRGAHYPQDQRFLDMCDEAGLLVWEETCGWNNTRDHFQDPKFVDQQMRQVDAMVNASFNHPSIIFWGFLNEGKSEQEESLPVYHKIVSRFKELDASRIITCCNMYRETTASRMPRTGIVCYNMYSGWYYGHYDDLGQECDQWLGKARKMLGEKLPFIVSEFGAEAFYGWHDPFATQWSEEHQASAISSAWTEILSRKDVAGLVIWQFCDTRRPDQSPKKSAVKIQRELAADQITAVGFGGGAMPISPRAHNCKGLVDEFRRPKLAYSAMRKLCANAPKWLGKT